MKGLRFEARKIVPVLTGSTHNDDAWYPSPALTSYIYFEPELRAPRNTNPGKFQGWGDMSQWREAASHEIVPKLAFTTSANPERGFKAFVLPDRWFVKLAAGTRQQLNYTGVENPLEQATLEGANNLSGNALRLFEEFRERGLDQEDFLLYIAGVYNSSLSHAYLSGQGGQVMRVPVSLDSEALQIAFEISEKARRVRDAKMLFWYLETGEDIPAEQVLTVMEESWIETLNFEKKSIVQGRYKGRDIIVANEGSREALENEIESGARSIDALARELFNVVNG
jgi:hypothetical protein